MDKSSINSKHFQQNKSILDDDCDNRSMKNPSQNYTNESQYNTENDLSDKFLPNSNFLSNYSKQERTNDFMKSSANLVSSRYSKQIVCGDKMNFRFEKDRCQDENEDELLLDTRRKLNRNESSFDSIGLKKKINLDININRSSDQEYSEIANDDEDEEEDDDEDQVLFTGYVPIALKYFTQQSKPRYWCLKMITSPWFERISMLIIIINCITLGMYQPCDDNPCTSTRCKILTQIDNFIFGFFAVEMVIKILAMGFYGKDTYMADSWNRLDFFIVLAGLVKF